MILIQSNLGDTVAAFGGGGGGLQLLVSAQCMLLLDRCLSKCNFEAKPTCIQLSVRYPADVDLQAVAVLFSSNLT